MTTTRIDHGDSTVQQILTPRQADVLAFVFSRELTGGTTYANQYAEENRITPNKALIAVNALINKGFLQRTDLTKIEGNSHYVRLLSLTEQGKNIATTIFSARLLENQLTA